MTLRGIKSDCYVGAAACVNNEAGFNLALPADEIPKKRVLSYLPLVEKQFRELGLSIAADTAKDLVQEVAAENFRRSYDWLIARIDAVESVARKELSNKSFLYVPPESAKFWPTKDQPYLFGELVASKFRSASADIFCAGTCLATAHPTASVFHLMRVLEVGLGAIGKVFNVSIENTNWQNAIDQIESKVRKMHEDAAWKSLPDCKEQQKFFSQAASHLGISKDAWRNHTMHSRSKYSDDEAERIFYSVKAFVGTLAEKLSE